ncbi:hypothetical protein [Streptomyces litchfieldiae]|uniref:Lipoprotein n=1 Tax=Streptomyces litchfieldiae TaxID=3075543 RepID=A0ABU2MN71_9ACTN|nr:hypothetical protein [Streptomyces sp. DSM 44938]MDT0342901.1 hypothetical protein [Streptomyces sp. DSM 44938]
MKRRTGVPLLAASASMATALLLTSCGGGDDDETDEIQGVETGEETTEEPTEEPSETPTEETGTERPEIDLGEDYQNVYEDTTTGDPEIDAIIQDLRGFQDAQSEMVISFESDRPALRYYISGAALDRTIRVFDDLVEGGRSSGGTARLFRFNVTLLEDQEGAATFSFCRDYTEVYTIDFDTREVVEEAESTAPADLYSGRLEQNADGVWQTVDYGFTNGAPECQ